MQNSSDLADFGGKLIVGSLTKASNGNGYCNGVEVERILEC
jgi:hypothetical protein